MLLPVSLAMLGFAANSLLCRLALKAELIDPATFTHIRLLSGALVLLLIIKLRRQQQALPWQWRSAFYLSLYALAFATAYIQLDAGSGALILFGAVQLSMIGHGLYQGERLNPQQSLGTLMAIAGLLALLLPGSRAPALGSSLLMALAGISWAAYSIAGRRASNATAATCANFILALPMLLLWSLVDGLLLDSSFYISSQGVMLAVLSGGLASGAAYALWYAVLPRLNAVSASTVQLSVPCIAMFGGVLLLDEALSLRLVFASLIILGGIALVIRARG